MMAPKTLRVRAEARISEDQLALLKTILKIVQPDRVQLTLGCPDHDDGKNIETVAKAPEGNGVLERQILNNLEQRLDQKLSKDLGDKADRRCRNNEARGLTTDAKVLGTPKETVRKYSDLNKYGKTGLGIVVKTAIIEGVKKLIGGG